MSTSAPPSPASESFPGFSTLEQLTDAHETLCVRQEEIFESDAAPTAQQEAAGVAFWEQVRSFVRAASATGAVLQVDAERSVALNLIVYWCNAIYRARHESLSSDLAKFNVSAARPLDDADFPYFRLRTGANEAALATGWQRQVETCLQLLDRERIVAVVGAPGSGRSSLVASGLVPALRAGQLRGSDAERVWVLPTGQRDPFIALAGTLAPAFPQTDVVTLAGRWRDNPADFASELRNSAPGSVLVIDQFEEFVGRCDAALRDGFAQAVLGLLATRHESSASFLVLVLRSDALNDLAEFPVLQRRCLDAEFFVAFDTVELRQAIEEPAKRVGLFFEPGLVNRILRDVQGDPAALTLLGFTLEQLWKLRGGNRNLMTWTAYEQVGSCRRALDAAADRTLKSLPGLEDAARQVFLMLVRPNWGDRFVAESAPRAKLEGLDPRAGDVIAAFLDTGLLREDAGQLGIAHEALITHWRTFSRWIDQRRLDLRERLALTAAAGQWLARQRDRSMLWRGTKLAEAREYPDLAPIEDDFLRASWLAQDRSLLRKQVALAVIGVLLATATVLAWVGRQAEKARAEAEKQRADATEKLRILESQALANVRLEVSSTLNEKGLALLESGDPAGGALWCVAALQMKVVALSDLWKATRLEPAALYDDADYRRIGSAIGQMPSLPRFHAQPGLVAVRPSHDGTRAVLVSRRDGELPGSVQLWKLETGERIPLPRGEFEGFTVSRAAFETSGKLFATASGEPGEDRGAVHFWQTSDGLPASQTIILEAAVLDVAFHPTNPRLVLVATASGKGAKGDVRILDRQTGATLKQLPHGMPLTRAVFNHDGSRVATSAAKPGGSLGEAHLWNWEEDEDLPLKHLAPVHWVEFSHDGRWLVTASGELTGERGEVQLWDAACGDAVGAPVTHDSAVLSAQFSPDDTRLLSAAGKDGTARIWELNSPSAATLLRHNGYVFCAAWSPDGRSVVTGSRDQMARVWDATTGRLLLPPLNHGGTVTAAEFSPDGRHLLAVTLGNARLWDLSSRSPIIPPLRAKGTVTHATASPDGLWLAVATKDDFLGTSEVRIADAVTGALRSPPVAFDGSIAHVAFSPDGKSLATAAANRQTRAATNRQTGEARIWNTETGAPASPPLAHPEPVTFVAFSQQDGRRLLTVGKGDSPGSTVRVWDAATGIALNERNVADFKVSGAALSPDGKRVACAGGAMQPRSGTALVWPVDRDGGPGFTVRHDENITTLAFDPTGQHLATGGADDAVKLWDARTGKLLRTMRHTADVTHVAFNDDGTRLVSSSFDSSATIWKTDNGERVATGRHTACVRRASFSANGRFIVTAGDDRTARVWDVETGEPVTILTSAAEVADAGFSGDGAASRVFALSYYWPTRLLETPTPTSSTAARTDAARSPTTSRPDTALDAPQRRVELRLWAFDPLRRPSEELEVDIARLAARRFARREGSARRDLIILPPAELAGLEGATPRPLALSTAAQARFHDDEATRCEFAEAWRAAAWHSGRALALVPSPTREALLRDARIHARLRDDWPVVVKRCDAVLLDPPNDVEARQLRAQAHLTLAQRLGPNAPGWQLAVADLESAVAAAPQQTPLWFALAEIHVTRRDWEKAEKALVAARTIEMADLKTKGARAPTWQRLAAVRLAGARAASDAAARAAWMERYRQTCAEMLELFGEIEEFGAMAAWPSLLAADSGQPAEQLVALAKKSSELQPMNFYRLNTLAAALYRAGKYEDALAQLDGSRNYYALASSASLARQAEPLSAVPNDPSRKGRPVDWIIAALAHAGAGRRDDARIQLNRTIEAVKETERGAGQEPLSSRRVWNLVELQLLIDEAQQAIR